MNISLTGALVGTAVGLTLFAVEYLILRAGAAERAKRKHRKGAFEFDGNERKQIASAAGFCAFIPPAFAAFAWLVWG